MVRVEQVDYVSNCIYGKSSETISLNRRYENSMAIILN